MAPVQIKTLSKGLIIALLAALIYIPGIGSVRLFDWDEINFAESAREMLVTGDWFNVRINFESFWEKPPLFIWMQALSMKIFGIGEFAARFPNALCGVLTLVLLFSIGSRLRDDRFGILWAIMYGCSLLPAFYFKSGIIDPWFNLFIFSGIYFFFRYSEAPSAKYAALSAAAIGLGILTKGPVAFLIFALTFFVRLCLRKFRFDFRWKDVALYIVVLCLVGGFWFIALALSGRGEVIKEFIDYQIRLFETKDAGHGGFLLYHFVWLFFGCIPASIFALPAFVPKRVREESDPTMAEMFKWMMTSFWVVLILFTVVKTKIVHYSSFCYYPLTFLAAYCAERVVTRHASWHKWQSTLLIALSTLYGIILTALTIFDGIKDRIIPYIQDPFAVKCLEAESDWIGFEPLIGVVLIICTIWFCLIFSRYRNMLNFAFLAGGNIFFLLTSTICAVGEVEKYTQASAVDFFIRHKGEECYILPANYKSYAHFFYSDRQPQNSCDDYDYLRSANLDKPCYFVLKDYDEDMEKFAQEVPDAKLLGCRSGFAFWVREKSSDKSGAAGDESCESTVEQ